MLERAETYGARARTDHSRRCSQHRRHGRRSAAGTDRRRSLRAAGRGPGRKTRFLTIARTGPAAVDRGEEVYGSRRRSGLAAAYRVSRYISGPAPKWRASPSRGVAIAHRGRARLQSMRFVPAKTFWRGQADKVWLRSRWRTALRPTDANRSLPSRCAQCPRGGRATGLIRALLVRRRIAVGQNVLDLELELSDGPHVPQKECFLTIAYDHERLFRDVQRCVSQRRFTCTN